METLGPAELLIILVIVLLVFGSSKLPKLARSLGQASSELKKGLHGGLTDDDAHGRHESAPRTDVPVAEPASGAAPVESEPEPT